MKALSAFTLLCAVFGDYREAIAFLEIVCSP
jgi:hypothetical protein